MWSALFELLNHSISTGIPLGIGPCPPRSGMPAGLAQAPTNRSEQPLSPWGGLVPAPVPHARSFTPLHASSLPIPIASPRKSKRPYAHADRPAPSEIPSTLLASACLRGARPLRPEPQIAGLHRVDVVRHRRRHGAQVDAQLLEALLRAQSRTTLPGLNRFSGSKVRLMSRIRSTASPSSSAR